MRYKSNTVRNSVSVTAHHSTGKTQTKLAFRAIEKYSLALINSESNSDPTPAGISRVRSAVWPTDRNGFTSQTYPAPELYFVFFGLEMFLPDLRCINS